MTFRMIDENGLAMDAHFDWDGTAVTLHSRGGTLGKPGATNTDYGKALRLLLTRSAAANLQIEGVWVDSSRVRLIPMEKRRILSAEDSGTPAEIFTLLSRRMKRVGRTPEAKAEQGSPTKRLRLELTIPPGFSEAIAERLGGRPVDHHTTKHRPFEAADLEKVTAEHVWNAVQQLLFERPSDALTATTDSYLIAGDGERLPPQTVFQLAATEALGVEVNPGDFSTENDSAFARILEDSGYSVVSTDTTSSSNMTEADPREEDGDREWLEGRMKLVSHFRHERAPGLAQAKKAAFRRVWGLLRCESCGMVPLDVYGEPHGEACIEVHHREIAVGRMSAVGHRTVLADLECLCANCHRVVHDKLRKAAAARVS